MPGVGPWNMETVLANIRRIFQQFLDASDENAAKTVRTKIRGPEGRNALTRFDAPIEALTGQGCANRAAFFRSNPDNRAQSVANEHVGLRSPIETRASGLPVTCPLTLFWYHRSGPEVSTSI